MSNSMPPHVVNFLAQEGPLRCVAPAVADLVPRLALRQYRRGNILCREDDPADIAWIIVSGWIRLYRFTRDGDEKVIGYRGRGQFAGEAAMLDNSRQECVAEAYTDAQCVVMMRADFYRLLADHSDFMRETLRMVSADRARLARDLVDLSILDARRRLICTLMTLADRYGTVDAKGTLRLSLPMTQLELAAIIGATRETLSRLCSGLPEVRIEQKELSITNWAEFQALHPAK
ncbi:MAG TPA: Crp/Fnr family transcriptional regulator [Candidatus Xenobia bacterium]|jgi:CRP-like cAMP-binding protein